MYPFIVLVPKSPSKIKYIHICKCGNIYEDFKKNSCPKCGNMEFFYIDDKEKLKPYLIGEAWGYEYPVYKNGEIIIKKEIFYEIKNDEIKVYKKDLSTFGEFIESYLIKNDYKIKDFIKYETNPYRWYDYFLNRDNPEIILFHENFRKYCVNKNADEIMGELLKNKSRSVKNAVLEKFKFVTKRDVYNPLIDEIILKSISNEKYKIKFIESTKNARVNFYDKNFIEKFVNFLKNYDEKRIIEFFEEIVKDDLIVSALEKFKNKDIKPICENILDNFLK